MIDVSQKLAETVNSMYMLQLLNSPIPTEALELREIMERCVAAEGERDRLRQALWPGLPKFIPTEDRPQQNFYEAVAEALRRDAAKLDSNWNAG